MSDDKNDRVPRDSTRINVNEDYEVQYWTQKLGVTELRLRRAVNKVGVMVVRVQQELGEIQE